MNLELERFSSLYSFHVRQSGSTVTFKRDSPEADSESLRAESESEIMMTHANGFPADAPPAGGFAAFAPSPPPPPPAALALATCLDAVPVVEPPAAAAGPLPVAITAPKGLPRPPAAAAMLPVPLPVPADTGTAGGGAAAPPARPAAAAGGPFGRVAATGSGPLAGLDDAAGVLSRAATSKGFPGPRIDVAAEGTGAALRCDATGNCPGPGGAAAAGLRL